MRTRCWRGLGWAVRATAVVLGVGLLGAGPAAGQSADPSEQSAAPDAIRNVHRKGAADPVTDGHGWMVIRAGGVGAARVGNGADRAMLLHIPPRTLGGVGESGTRELEGVVRVAIEFRSPRADSAMLSWWRNRVYVGQEGEIGSGGHRAWQVFRLTALRNAGTFYDYRPSGRFEDLGLPAQQGELRGIAATPSGVVALLAETGESRRLLEFDGNKWWPLDVPWEGAGKMPGAPVGKVRLLTWRNGWAIATGPERGVLDVWVRRMSGSGGVEKGEWERREYGLGEIARGTDRDGGSLRLAFVEQQRATEDALLAVVSSAQSGISVYALRAGAGSVPDLLTVLADAPATAMIAPMTAPGDTDGPTGTLALAWPVVAGSSGAASEVNGLELREISAATGRVMYAGRASPGETVNWSALQSIVVLTLLGGVCVLLLLVRPVPHDRVEISNQRMADPVRRLAAAAIDYAPGAMLVALAEGRGVLVLLMPSTMFGGGGVTLGEMNLGPLGMAVALTIAHAGVCEWLLGRSVGKFMMGLRVVSVEEGAGERKPELWQAMTRNVVRWIVPILAVFAMLDERGRHAGDLAARTLVVADENDGR